MLKTIRRNGSSEKGRRLMKLVFDENLDNIFLLFLFFFFVNGRTRNVGYVL